MEYRSRKNLIYKSLSLSPMPSDRISSTYMILDIVIVQGFFLVP